MSYWDTRSSGRRRDYVVLKHNLKGINTTIQGVRFRNGFAVLEKGSKAYLRLKSLPNLKRAKEYPLTYLRLLPFITRTQDIQTVYGRDVYYNYIWAMEEEQKAKQEEEQRAKQEAEQAEQEKREQELKQAEEAEKSGDVEQKPEITKCTHRTNKGKLCKNDAVEGSPSNYCEIHLLKDPKLKELGIEVPSYMTKKEKKKFKNTVINKLNKRK